MPDDTTAWLIKDIWFATRTATRLEVVEENLRFIKLVFPPYEEATWKGNLFINAIDDLAWYADWEYEFTGVDESKTVGGISFAKTLTVLQIDYSENRLEYIYGLERYATKVGLIYKELIHLERSTFSGPWEKGFILIMTVNSYGNL